MYVGVLKVAERPRALEEKHCRSHLQRGCHYFEKDFSAAVRGACGLKH